MYKLEFIDVEGEWTTIYWPSEGACYDSANRLHLNNDEFDVSPVSVYDTLQRRAIG